MLNTLDIGKYINNALRNDASINCKVYPIVADNKAVYPFIVYKRTNLQSSICKDGTYEDSVDVEVVVVADKYIESIEIAQNIRRVLERQEAYYDDIEIDNGTIILATEEFSNDAFVQRMQFNFIVKRRF